MNLTWLEDFLALAATGSFSRAADLRHVTQPAFSRRIRALEDWLGVVLIDRSTQPARLTEVGQWFHGVARDEALRLSRLPETARQVATGTAAALRIASTHALSLTFLPSWLRAIERDLPLESVQLYSDMVAACAQLLEQGKVQFVVAHAHPQAAVAFDQERCTSRLIGQDTLVPVSAPDARGKPLHGLSTGSVAPVSVLRYSEQSGLWRIVETLFEHECAMPPMRISLTAHLASVLRSMVLDGRGLAWLPMTLVASDLQCAGLVLAGPAHLSIPVQIRLYRHREDLGRVAETFWDQSGRQPSPSNE